MPDDVAQAVRKVSRWVAVESYDLAARIMREADALSYARPFFTESQSTEGESTTEVLVRYREPADMPANLRAAGVLPEVHGAMLASVVLLLAGVPDLRLRVVWFDPAPYFEWLDTAGHNLSDDSEQLRSKWATLRALPAQAMPPRGDQPPA